MYITQGDRVYYYENIEGGHGGAADNKQRAFMACLYLQPSTYSAYGRLWPPMYFLSRLWMII